MKHKLLIEDIEKLSDDIWQDPDLLDDVKQVNTTIKMWVEELTKLYNLLDGLDEPLPFDTYILGDIINLLAVVEAVEEK